MTNNTVLTLYYWLIRSTTLSINFLGSQYLYPYTGKDNIVIDVFALTLHVDLGTVGQ